MFRLYSLLIGIVLGHIQTSYILGKTIRKIDIRNYGSGNAGMTNSLRVMGLKFAIPTLIIDALKSFGAFIICAALFEGSGSFFSFDGGTAGIIPGLYGSLGAILGHLFPVYMRFKGGKGMACGTGLLLALNLPLAGIILGMFLIVTTLTRYISLASIICLAMFPICLAIFKYEPEAIIIGVCIMTLLVFKHKENIKRLLKGTENKVGQKI